MSPLREVITTFVCIVGYVYTIGVNSAIATSAYIYRNSQTSYAQSPVTGINTATIRYASVASESCYIKIEPYSSYQYGNYSVTVKEYSPDSFFTITNPVSSPVWDTGSTQQIQWKSDTLIAGKTVSVILCKDSLELLTLLAAGSNNGSNPWRIPGTLASGNNYRIKLKTAQSFTYSNTFTINGFTVDSFETDNSIATAKRIKVNEIQQHTLTPGDTDWIAISPLNGYYYQFTYKSSLNVNMTLYKVVNNNLVLISSYNNPLEDVTKDTATYFIKLYSNTSTPSSYSFTVNHCDVDSLFQFVKPNSSTVWTTTASALIEWTTNSIIANKSFIFTLCKDTMQYDVLTSLVINNGIYSSSVRSNIETDSNYRVQMSLLSNSIKVYSEKFKIIACPSDTFEPDNSFDQATPIIPNTETQTHMVSSRESDWVSFKPTKGYIYSINVHDNLLKIDLYKFNSSLGSISTSTASARYVGPDTSTIYARVRTSEAECYKYTITVKSTDPSLGVAFTNPTNRTTWSSGSIYTLKWKTDSLTYQQNVTLELYKDSSKAMTIASNISNTGEYSWSIPAGLLTSEKYRIKLSDYSNSTVSGFSDTFAISGINIDVFEPDNKISAAIPLLPGISQTHTLPLNDTDYCSVEITKGDLYVFETSGSFVLKYPWLLLLGLN